jgi:hypothetical protein
MFASLPAFCIASMAMSASSSKTPCSTGSDEAGTAGVLTAGAILLIEWYGFSNWG